MTKKNVCKMCKVFYDGSECPNGHSAPAAAWQGRLNIIDAEKSFISKKTGITKKGEYAIKVR